MSARRRGHRGERSRAALRDDVAAVVRPVTEFERSLLDWVVLWDEYHLGDRRFEAGDVVVDVGAHVGVFTAMCHRLGSRSIHAFEADPRNYERLAQTAEQLDGVTIDPRAVFRSDLPSGSIALEVSGALRENTGASNVLFGGRPFDVHAQVLDAGDSEPVADVVGTVGLDDLLVGLGRVRLLKLDCEGSEFPILLTSRRLDLVDEIIGEYHLVGDGPAASLVDEARLGGLRSYEPALLAVTLGAAGFEVTMLSAGPTIGQFRAVRPEAV